MKAFLCRLGLVSCLLLCIAGSQAQPEFPSLTGRVVDNADLVNSQTEATLTNLLAQHEQQTTNQVVVVTVGNLQGYTIEEFGYQLGRHWGIGQAETNNGVLLLVAKDERKVRIEIGYGLEGALTDALAADIIQRVILPNFKRANFDQGIAEGTQAILQAIAGEYEAKPREAGRESKFPLLLLLLVVGGFVFLPLIFASIAGAPSGRSYGTWGGYHGGGGFGRGGGFGGGGFGGGGGGFGGGGASGGW